MRPMRALLIYLAVIFLGAALLAPWLYRVTQWSAAHFDGLSRLRAQPFHRFVNRAMLGIAIAGCWPFLRSIGVNSWSAVGLVKWNANWPRLLAGFVLGFGSLACVALVATAGGGRTVNYTYPAAAYLSKSASAAISAIVVGFVEELLFRGALFGALRKSHGWATALVVSSAVYALVHFFQKPPSPSFVTWSSGLELMARMWGGFADLEM